MSSDLGEAKRVVIDKDNTTIVEGSPSKKARHPGDRGSGQAAPQAGRGLDSSDYDREKLQERLAKLAGGVAVINVGAATETEMKEKKARVEDAMHATKAAVEGGIVPGGGVALLRVMGAVAAVPAEGDVRLGVEIVRRALQEPTRQIAINAGQEGGVVVRDVMDRSGSWGFNAATGLFEDLVAAGIIDPAKVTKTALQNAGSIAGLMLTTEAMVSELPAGEPEAQGVG